MEPDQQFVIPTTWRAKISHKLSYPVGAERISVALASAPQLAELKLRFSSGSDVQLRGGHYEFLRVDYLNNAPPSQEWPISILFYGYLERAQWEIVVQPVPRTLRHRVRQYILDSALAEIAQWLIQRKELGQQGNDILAFFYDEKGDVFVSRHLTRLEPLR